MDLFHGYFRSFFKHFIHQKMKNPERYFRLIAQRKILQPPIGLNVLWYLDFIFF